MSYVLRKLEEKLIERRDNIAKLETSRDSNIREIEKELGIRIEQIRADYQAKIDEEGRELGQIETAIVVVRGIETPSLGDFNSTDAAEVIPVDVVPPTSTDGTPIRRKRKPGRKKGLGGKTALQAVCTILDDSDDEYLEPIEIARRAISRGYLGRVNGDDPDRNAASFFDVLRRRPHLFLRDEHDRFRLRRDSDPPFVVPEHQPFYKRSRAWLAERVLEASGRPMTTTEIAQVLVEQGKVVGKDVRAISNALINSLNRLARFEKLDEGLYRLKPKSLNH